jgi:heat shock protein HslJ
LSFFVREFCFDSNRGSSMTDAKRVAMWLVAFLTVTSALTSCLTAGRSAGMNDLPGTSWELTTLSGSELLPGTAITLDFEEEDLSGSAGCNHYGAGYQLSENSLSVGDIAVTEMACPEPQGILEQEAAYLTALSGAASYQVAGEQLEIRDETSEQVLLFVPAANTPVSQPDVPPDAPVVIQNATATSTSEVPATAAAMATATVPMATAGPPPGFQVYEDETIGVALLLPENWTVTQIVPGQSTILQSYPEDKYVGGEARDPTDTKCDLTIRPSEIDLAGHLEQVRSDPTITVVSETEIVLQSGEPAIRLELESMGQSRSLVTAINERIVVLSCFGELAPFDALALSLGSSEGR